MTHVEALLAQLNRRIKLTKGSLQSNKRSLELAKSKIRSRNRQRIAQGKGEVKRLTPAIKKIQADITKLTAQVKPLEERLAKPLRFENVPTKRLKENIITNIRLGGMLEKRFNDPKTIGGRKDIEDEINRRLAQEKKISEVFPDVKEQITPEVVPPKPSVQAQTPSTIEDLTLVQPAPEIQQESLTSRIVPAVIGALGVKLLLG